MDCWIQWYAMGDERSVNGVGEGVEEWFVDLEHGRGFHSFGEGVCLF